MSNLSSSNSGSGGIGTVSVLGIIFVVLKLVGVIEWSWLWVLAPWWISLLLIFVILIIAKCFMGSEWR